MAYVPIPIPIVVPNAGCGGGDVPTWAVWATLGPPGILVLALFVYMGIALWQER